ncbi:MAG TPA: hypothetical protein PLU35_00920 [Phycisphaerales bacterium]|nr:hypothetical protein [Phycisphaerales bacterium]
MIVYRVRYNDATFDVTDFEPPTYYGVGEHVAFPVKVRAFTSSGRAMWGLQIDRGDGGGIGEPF